MSTVVFTQIVATWCWFLSPSTNQSAHKSQWREKETNNKFTTICVKTIVSWYRFSALGAITVPVWPGESFSKLSGSILSDCSSQRKHQYLGPTSSKCPKRWITGKTANLCEKPLRKTEQFQNSRFSHFRSNSNPRTILSRRLWTNGHSTDESWHHSRLQTPTRLGYDCWLIRIITHLITLGFPSPDLDKSNYSFSNFNYEKIRIRKIGKIWKKSVRRWIPRFDWLLQWCRW